MSAESSSHEHLVNDLREHGASLEREKSEVLSNFAVLQQEKLEMEERTVELEKRIEERDIALAELRSDLNNSKTSDIDRLNGIINQLKVELERATAKNHAVSESLEHSKEAMKKQEQDMKKYISDFVLSMKAERASLLSDVEAELREEKSRIMMNTKSMVNEYGRKVENQKLNQAMKFQMMISSLRSDSCEARKNSEQQLSNEKNKVRHLEQLLAKLKHEDEDTKETMKAACLALAVNKDGLIEKLEDMEVEMAGYKSDKATLLLDLATIQSLKANLEHNANQLILQNEDLANKLIVKDKKMTEIASELENYRDKLRLQTEEMSFANHEVEQAKREVQQLKQEMSEVQHDSQDQIEKGRSVIQCLEEAMVAKENECEYNRRELCNMKDEMKRKEEAFDKCRRTHESVVESMELTREVELQEAELRQEKLKANAHILEKQVTILKDQSIELSAQYSCMSNILTEIEYESQNNAFELRKECDRLAHQFNECQNKLVSSEDERSSLQSQLQEKAETIRNIWRASQTKIDELAEHYMTIEDELRSQLSSVKCEKDALNQKLAVDNELKDKLMDGVHALECEYKTICSEFDRVSIKKETIACNVEILEGRVKQLEHYQDTAEILAIDLANSKLKIEQLESEIREANATIDVLSNNIETSLGEKADLIRKQEDSLEELRRSHEIQVSEATCKVRELQSEIEGLELALEESRAECLLKEKENSASCEKLEATSLQLSRYEEDNLELLSSNNFYEAEMKELQSKLSDFEMVTAEQESLISDMKDSLIREKSEYLFALANAEQEIHKQSEIDLTKITSLQSKLKSSERQRQEEFECFEEKIAEVTTQLNYVEALKLENEKALTNQIKLLKEDNEVEFLYNELMDKMKTTEMQCEENKLQYEEQIHRLQEEVQYLRNPNQYLTN